jgi:hypothetical protein
MPGDHPLHVRKFEVAVGIDKSGDDDPRIELESGFLNWPASGIPDVEYRSVVGRFNYAEREGRTAYRVYPVG